MSILATGKRLLPQPGNAGAVNFHGLRGLLPGNYSWSVQTADRALDASMFAAETSFVITTPPTPLQFTSVSVLSGVQVRVTNAGRPGASVLIERSVDLQSWSSVGSYQLDVAGALTWSGTSAGAAGFSRFTETP